jgi:hypothetical protein
MTISAFSAASASAIALPIPLFPPVTMATLPVRLMFAALLVESSRRHDVQSQGLYQDHAARRADRRRNR